MPLCGTASFTSSVMSVTVRPPAVRRFVSRWKTLMREVSYAGPPTPRTSLSTPPEAKVTTTGGTVAPSAGPVAQRLEQPAHNRLVPGSNPGGPMQDCRMASIAAFTGYVPEYYDRRMVPLLFAPYADELVARVPARDGLRVLELACGTGVVTRKLREALPPSASLVATDLNEAMTDYARSVVPAAGIDWRVADMQALPFEDGSFDVVVCQYGFMFPPDKPQAF